MCPFCKDSGKIKLLTSEVDCSCVTAAVSASTDTSTTLAAAGTALAIAEKPVSLPAPPASSFRIDPEHANWAAAKSLGSWWLEDQVPSYAKCRRSYIEAIADDRASKFFHAAHRIDWRDWRKVKSLVQRFHIDAIEPGGKMSIRACALRALVLAYAIPPEVLPWGATTSFRVDHLDDFVAGLQIISGRSSIYRLLLDGRGVNAHGDVAILDALADGIIDLYTLATRNFLSMLPGLVADNRDRGLRVMQPITFYSPCSSAVKPSSPPAGADGVSPLRL